MFEHFLHAVVRWDTTCRTLPAMSFPIFSSSVEAVKEDADTVEDNVIEGTSMSSYGEYM